MNYFSYLVINIINLLILIKKNILNKLKDKYGDGDWGLGVWDLGIGIGGLGFGPKPQSPIPNPQSPIPINKEFIESIYIINQIN